MDSSGDTSGFSDVINEVDYTYDLYGNMVRDLNKGINAITYNHLNLPQKITFAGANNTIEYLYDALGKKVQKTVTENGVAVVTDYIDGYQYIGSVLQFFPTAEGYVSVSTRAPNYNYVYQYKDHLGNIRLNFAINLQGKITVMEENNYYPFGMKHNNYNVIKLQYDESEGQIDLNACSTCRYKYKYNGKEL